MDKKKRARIFTRKQQKKTHTFPVQVSYADPTTSIVLTINVTPQTTILEAIKQSRIQKLSRKIRVVEGRVGIYSEIKPLDTRLQENDRIEIYRPLTVSPKEARKNRIKQKEGSE